MTDLPRTKLYGSATCHKTKYYQELLDEMGVAYEFLDVVASAANAEALRGLYTNRRLNFPTITIDHKKLRNPSRADLVKWLDKLTQDELS